MTNGFVITHEYAGSPIYKSTELVRLQVGELVFVAHFKGPVFCFNPSANRHFVIWAPGWIYHWPTTLAHSPEFLFIAAKTYCDIASSLGRWYS
jgi:hypothetical protein